MFCENCGKEVASGLPVCPHCGQATGVSPSPKPAPPAATAGPRSASIFGERPGSLLSRAEKSFYFRLARGFSWFLLIVITFGLVVNAYVIVPEVFQAVWASTSVGPQKLNSALSSPSSSLSSSEGGASLDPAEMAHLDKVAYEIIQLLPASASSGSNVDYLRGQIRGLASNLSDKQSEQLAILRELRDDLRSVPASQRMQAINTYSNLKAQVIQDSRNKEQAARQELVFSGASLVSGIIVFSLVTMMLVLLWVERNTRTSQA